MNAIIHIIQFVEERSDVTLSIFDHFICMHNTVFSYIKLIVIINTRKSRCFNLFVFLNSYIIIGRELY